MKFTHLLKALGIKYNWASENLFGEELIDLSNSNLKPSYLLERHTQRSEQRPFHQLVPNIHKVQYFSLKKY